MKNITVYNILKISKLLQCYHINNYSMVSAEGTAYVMMQSTPIFHAQYALMGNHY
jgi:hypothetical protein